MTLSDSAERGRKTAAAVSVMCFVISAFSLLTFNIPMAAMGFAAAYHIKKGSLTARNFAILLRIADVPVLALISAVAARFTGDFLPVYVIAVGVTAVLDVVSLLILMFGRNINAYFKETYAASGENAEDNDTQ
ncbi:MAG: hypothetical protein J6C96_10765 [Oscillospiraceae bacterium]|nr:hypothetical protein [Oscillospiraceae bacterium]